MALFRWYVVYILCGLLTVSLLKAEPRRVLASETLVNVTVSSGIGIGTIMLKVHPEWAPLGAERFLTLVREKFYDDTRFFRVIKVLQRIIST